MIWRKYCSARQVLQNDAFTLQLQISILIQPNTSVEPRLENSRTTSSQCIISGQKHNTCEKKRQATHPHAEIEGGAVQNLVCSPTNHRPPTTPLPPGSSKQLCGPMLGSSGIAIQEATCRARSNAARICVYPSCFNNVQGAWRGSGCGVVWCVVRCGVW